MKEENTLAMELLHELKKSSKRNFIIAIILLIALITSNLAWLIYESQYEEVSTEEVEKYITQEQDGTEKTNMSGVIN